MKLMRKIFIPVLVLVIVAALAVAPGQAKPAQAAGSSIVYNLFATDTFTVMADGTPVYNYGFVGGRSGAPLTFQNSFSPDGSSGGDNNIEFGGGAPSPAGGLITAEEFKLQGNAQFPAPLIYASVGDVVEIHFKNLGVSYLGVPNDPHSIHLHALDVNAANDGVPETSIGAVPANLCADGSTALKGENCATPAPGAGNVIVYMFSPKDAGTYMYHCHQEADIHVQMGMYGALIVYNRGDAAAATGPGSGRGGTLYGWKYDKDYVLLESEIDVRQHCSEQGTYGADGLCSNPFVPTVPGQPSGYNPVDYQPQFWFLNGLSFPNTIHVASPGGPVVGSFDNWIAAHPGYDPFIVGSVSTPHPKTAMTRGDKILIRMINMGYETQPMHMHGFHGKVIGSDQRAWFWANLAQITPWGQGEEKNTLTIGSGETYDWLINMGLQAVTGDYPAGTQTRYDPATNFPDVNGSGNPAIPVDPGDPLSPTYIAGPTVTGAIGVSTPGQLFPFHNHDDYKATNNGAYPGGMFTMIMPLP